MPSLFVFLILLPSLTLTVLKARSAYVWLSFAAASLFAALINYGAMFVLGSGHMTEAMTAVLRFARGRGETRTGTLFNLAGEALSHGFIPALVIGLLLVVSRAHPKRSPVDIVLFWSSILCLITWFMAPYFFLVIRTYGASQPVGSILVAMLSLLYVSAAARPIRSWWQEWKSQN